MGICELLTIIFVLCKLFNVISWSWWLVLLPEIIAIALYIVVFIISISGAVFTTKKVKKSFKDWR